MPPSFPKGEPRNQGNLTPVVHSPLRVTTPFNQIPTIPKVTRHGFKIEHNTFMKRRHVLWLYAALPCVAIAGCLLRENLPTQPVTRQLSPSGVKTVVFRASNAPTAKILISKVHQIQISGVPAGGAKGYHSPDPFWRETPAKDWGLDFVAKRYGDVLVVSTTNEILYIHHHYVLTNLSIQVPSGIKVIKEERELNGAPEPDLKPPT